MTTSRRDFIKAGLAGSLAVGTGGLLSACGTVIGVGLGVLAVARRDSVFDHVLSVVSLAVTGPQLLGHDAKRLHVFHQMTSSDVLAATCELIFLHVSEDHVALMPAEAAAAVAALAAAHAPLPRPEKAGRHIAMPARVSQAAV